MEKKIMKILKEAIRSFKNIDKMDIIATFGDVKRLTRLNVYEIDLIIISNKKLHEEFTSHLQEQFKKELFKPIVFETITEIHKTLTKKSKKQVKGHILIHDLNYRSISDLLKKEWKSVINSMKHRTKILYGDKKFPNKLPFLKISKEELLEGIIKWSKKIYSEEQFKIFKTYLLKIIPKLLKDYAYLDLSNLKDIQKLLNQKVSWDKKLKNVKIFLSKR